MNILINQGLLYISISIYIFYFIFFKFQFFNLFFKFFILSSDYKNEPEADIDDEKGDNEGEENNVLDLEKRSTDPESRKGRSRGSPFRPFVARALWRPRRRSGVRRRRRNG